MAALPPEEVVAACLDACRALRKAYGNILRKNIEAMLRHYNVSDDDETVTAVVAEVSKRLEDAR